MLLLLLVALFHPYYHSARFVTFLGLQLGRAPAPAAFAAPCCVVSFLLLSGGNGVLSGATPTSAAAPCCVVSFLLLSGGNGVLSGATPTSAAAPCCPSAKEAKSVESTILSSLPGGTGDDVCCC